MKKYLYTILISAAVGAAAGAFVVRHYVCSSASAYNNPQSVSAPIQKVAISGTATAVDFTAAVEQSVDAVVHVKTSYTRIMQSAPDLFDYFFGFRDYRVERTPSTGVGSGVIISKNGYIVTNNHVIDKAQEIQVALNDKRTFSATLVGTDPSTDIAVLKIESSKEFPYLDFGSSDDLKLGEWVIAIGNPFNLTSTVTAGIVSAKARNINILSDRFKIESFIQTDAPVNPGNSGGALINTRGELVGINTAIASPTGTYAGYSFAVPSSIAKKAVADIIEFGVVQRAILGIQYEELTADIAKSIGSPLTEGILVKGIMDNSAAAQAGIKVNDVIVRINDVNVNSVAHLQEQLSKYRPNDQIALSVNRGGKQMHINVILRNKEGTTRIVTKDDISIGFLKGAKFASANPNTLRKLHLSSGVEVVEVGAGALREQGVRKGYIIARINRIAVGTPQDVERILEQSTGDVALLEGVYPNGMRAYYAFGVQ
jgi:Do/DeqQ family serine protease